MIKLITVRLDDEGTRFEGEAPPEVMEFGEGDLFQALAPLAYDVQAALTRGGAIVTGKVSTRVSAVCGRCLRTVELAVASDDVCHFHENPLPEIIDLTSGLREDILLALPRYFVCSDSCRGLCPVCAVDLNEVECGCHDSNANTVFQRALEEMEKKRKGK